MNDFKRMVALGRRHRIKLDVAAAVLTGIGIAVVYWPKASGEAASIAKSGVVLD